MDILSKQEISEKIDLCKLHIEVFDEIDSTNNYAKKLILEGFKEGLIVADSQTAGRGRSGHSFYSPENTGIYMSYFFTPKNGLAGAESCTTKTAVAMVTALESLYSDSFNIKWVNDIYYGGKKISGILAEAVTTGINVGGIVIGIGINVSTKDYPDDIKDRAGHLPVRSDISRNDIIAEIINNLVPLLEKETSDKSYVNLYRDHLLMIGELVTFLDHSKSAAEAIHTTATIIDIDDECGLIVKEQDGTLRTIRNGEVSELRWTE
ncbi:MAG: biotin--[acetyl-CoA-carboxylase] ligase [Lachnospiraceae bacterium]|nr:biotin--[acetyl-CoA-carboxylase] ligase [Lachnospiraceae bacterium]